jgi:hypothetical protein
MGCHLHDLIEDYEKKRIGVFSQFDKPRGVIAKLLRLSQTAMGSAMCFDMGNLDSLIGIQLIPELCKLPYENCWFEGLVQSENIQSYLIGILANQRLDGKFDLWIFSKSNAAQVWTFHSTLSQAEHIKANGEETHWGMSLQMDDKNKEFVFSISSFMCLFLSALNCINVSRVEHKPDPKLVKARSKRGRRPMYSYWTLQLDFDRGSREPSMGCGTHSSPRLHLRRGHARQFIPGKWCWVQPHVVGSKSEGMIHKEYAVKQKEGGVGHGTN